MNQRYDAAIIGTGPAGLSAAITLKIRNKNVLLIGSAHVSEKVEKAHEINNYLGIPAVSGADLAQKFLDHASRMGITITEDPVTSIYAMGDYYSMTSRSNQTYEATALILATGVHFQKPYPGETDFLGRGVSYCATCDGVLYRGRNVAVIASSAQEEQEAEYLSELAGQVYYIPTYDEPVSLPDNIQVIRDTPASIKGEMKVDTLELKSQELPVDGVFILRESIAPAQLVFGLEVEGSHVKVNRSMETNLPGCFACGDITGTPYQYIKAAGEGNVAALSAASYIDRKKKETR